jgi:hypothetical protein
VAGAVAYAHDQFTAAGIELPAYFDLR